MKSAIVKLCTLPILADTINEYHALGYDFQSVAYCGLVIGLAQEPLPSFVLIMTKEVKPE